MSTRLNLISETADRELDAIRRIVERHVATSGLDDLVGSLNECARRAERVEVIDVIGHSSAEGFLVLGTWALDDAPQTAAAFSELLRPALDRMSVHTIRLLGCSTASTERARSAMRRIAYGSGRRVLGTRRYIGEHDYGPAGFVSDHLLVAM